MKRDDVLMDHGTWLAGQVENPNRRSRHYSRQSAFEGSDRHIGGGFSGFSLTGSHFSLMNW